MPKKFNYINAFPKLVVILIAGVFWLFSCDHQINESGNEQRGEVDSIAFFTKRIISDSSNAQLFADRARVYLANGNLDPALRDLNRALILQPDEPSLYLMLSDVYLVLGQTDNSLTALKKAIRLRPDQVASYLKLAEVYLLIDDPHAASGAADKAIQLDVNNAESYYIKGISLLQAGDTLDAVLNLKISIRVDTANFMSYMQLASIAVAQGDTMAVYYLKQALIDQPQDERALFFLGMTLQEKRDYYNALEYFKQVVQLYPKNKRAYYHAGYICLAELSQPEYAVEFFGQAVTLDSNYVEAVYNLGRSYEELADYKNARRLYRKSLIILPNYPLAVQGLNRLDDQKLGL